MKATRFAAPILSLALLSGAGMAFAQYGGPPPPPPPGYYPQGGWDAAPQEFRDAQRRGFHDGIEGARKDFENHRQPNVNNRDEYRHPNFIPGPDRRDYKYGFRQGYDVAVRHMYGPGPR